MSKSMVRRDHPELGLSHQCRFLSISRSSAYHTLLPVEPGSAVSLLGAGALGFAACLTRSAAVDRRLITEVEQHIDELESAI